LKLNDGILSIDFLVLIIVNTFSLGIVLIYEFDIEYDINELGYEITLPIKSFLKSKQNWGILVAVNPSWATSYLLNWFK